MPAETQSLTITSSYEGEMSLPYIAPAILSADSIANGYVTLKEGVKKALILKVIAGGAMQAFACDFEAQTGITLAERVLTPTELKVNVQLCKADFRQDYEALQTGAGFINDRIPPNFNTFLLQYLAEIVSKGIEQNMWQGNFDPLGAGGAPLVTDFDGFLKLYLAGSNKTGTAGAWTGDAETTGIITHLSTMVAGAPVDIVGNPDTVIYMSRQSLFLLQVAMSSLTGTSHWSGEARPGTYNGYNILTPAGFPSNCALMTTVANNVVGTDLASDFNQAVVVDMTQTDGSDNVRLAMRFTAGVQVADITNGYELVCQTS
tara:strand:+ start:98 stop:1048 length:951 start_codon:yes stop_codon:yes gene_type:complete